MFRPSMRVESDAGDVDIARARIEFSEVKLATESGGRLNVDIVPEHDEDRDWARGRVAAFAIA